MHGQFTSTRSIRGTVILIMALAILAASPLPLAAQNTGVTGAVKNASGEPVVGALVKIRNEERGLAFTVVSQAQGRYSTPNLLPGKYAVQGFGGDVQTEPRQIEVKSEQQGKLDVVLSIPLKIAPPQKRLTDADYAKLMPESDARGKRMVTSRCTYCHGLLRIVSVRRTREQWQETVDRMRLYMLDQRRRLVIIDRTEEQEGEWIMDYLAKYLTPDNPPYPEVAAQLLLRSGGPSSSNSNLPPSLLKDAAAKYTAMEFNLPRGSSPHDIAIDSQGIAWVSEKNTGMLGRFDPDSLSYARIASPAAEQSQFKLNSVAVGPGDQLWFVDDGPKVRMLQYSPKSREFNTYPIPDSSWGRIKTLRFLDGNVWATATNRILKLDPKIRKFVDYPVPKGSQPYGLAIGGDKLVWYAAQIGNVVVKLDPATGSLTPYKLSTPLSEMRRMATDAEGNLWVAATESGKLVKVEYQTGKITEFTPPTGDSGPFAVDVDTKRNLVWFSELFTGKIGRFDASKNSFVEFPAPNSDLGVRRIEVDPKHPNRVWWSESSSDKIGYLEVLE